MLKDIRYKIEEKHARQKISDRRGQKKIAIENETWIIQGWKIRINGNRTQKIKDLRQMLEDRRQKIDDGRHQIEDRRQKVEDKK